MPQAIFCTFMHCTIGLFFPAIPTLFHIYFVKQATLLQSTKYRIHKLALALADAAWRILAHPDAN